MHNRGRTGPENGAEARMGDGQREGGLAQRWLEPLPTPDIILGYHQLLTPRVRSPALRSDTSAHPALYIRRNSLGNCLSCCNMEERPAGVPLPPMNSRWAALRPFTAGEGSQSRGSNEAFGSGTTGLAWASYRFPPSPSWSCGLGSIRPPSADTRGFAESVKVKHRSKPPA